MRNAAPYVRACMDSILAQTFRNFELVVVDDGSTDGSADIVAAYGDPRIRLFRCAHDYVASLNRSLDEARGRYVARMDADDVMLPERLALQRAWLEAHPEVDGVGARMSAFRRDPAASVSEVSVRAGRVTLSDLLDGCCVCHPTVMLRASCLNGSERFRYDPAMAYAEDYDLWVRLLSAGKRLHNLPDAVVCYRLHDAQATAVHRDEQAAKSALVRHRALARWEELATEAFEEPARVPDTGNRLTVVMPFLNEGEEVARTARSIRETAGEEVDIIAIDDDSDDGFDYEGSLAGLGVTCLRNRCRIGAALSKERGARLARTPYFLLLDAHMRFYAPGWHRYVAAELDRDPMRLLCSKSVSLNKNERGEVFRVPDAGVPNGAYLLFEAKRHVPAVAWNYSEAPLPGCAAGEIACVLGAGYAASKRYWEKIKGLQGLVHYGCEEAFISIKAWMEGGGCHLLRDLAIGHVYRKAFPYPLYSFQHIYNYLLISELLFPTSERLFARAVAWQLDKRSFNAAMELMELRRPFNERLREHFKTFSRHDFAWVKRLNDACRKAEQRDARISDEDAERVVRRIGERLPGMERIGLFDGLAGALVAVLLRVEAGHEDHAELASAIWEKLSREFSRQHNLSFRTGLAGVGWALVYSASHRLIEDSVEDELAAIDRKIMTLSVRRSSDLSFLDGLGGIYCYVTARLGFDRRNGRENATFAPDFLQEMDREACRVMEETDDWRTKSFVGQFAERESGDWEILAPEFPEVAGLPDYVPKDERKWELTLAGVVGAAINKMTNDPMKNNQNEEKSL